MRWRWLLRSGLISSWPRAALENGKHVFVEKPFTCTTAQAEELIELAERKNLKIMVDHTFLFTGAVKRIKQIDRRRHARKFVLLRFDARESGAVPARRERDLGSWRRTIFRSWTI